MLCKPVLDAATYLTDTSNSFSICHKTWIPSKEVKGQKKNPQKDNLSSEERRDNGGVESVQNLHPSNPCSTTLK